MGERARLDLVEFASDAGDSAAYDVAVYTPLRASAAFRAECARFPGHACSRGFDAKLNSQYRYRAPGAKLLPLTAEIGGRWHPSVPMLIRRLARDYVARCPGLDASAVGPVVARWGARLSALLLRGNAAVMRAGGLPRPTTLGVDAPGSASLCHSLPVGECAYELLVG